MSSTFTHKGHTFTVKHVHDSYHEPPWESGDGYGIVTDWINYRADEAADYKDESKYRALNHDHGSVRYYDWQASLDKAREEQWGLTDADKAKLAARIGHEPTAEEVTAEAVRKDYEFLRGWCQDEWSYVGVVVALQGTDYEQSLWGIESNADAYLAETARELADAILDDAPAQIDADVARLQALRASLP